MDFAPHPYSLRQLQYAVAVAELLSFRRAAERCHVSQPSLSAQLAQLEASLGVQLFERGGRKVLVTRAGADVIDRARRLLVAADDLLSESRRASDPLSGSVRIGVIPTIAPYLLPTMAPRLRSKFKKLTVLWREDKTAELMVALERGTLDAALLARESELGDVEMELVGEDPFVLACAAKHPLGCEKSAVTSAELRGADVMLLDDGHCFRDQALEVCARLRLHEGEFRATSLATLVQMVAAGMGVTLLPGLAVATETRHAALSIRPIASPRAHRTLVLVWRKRAALSEAMRAIAAEIRKGFLSESPESLSGSQRPTRRGRPSGDTD
ncbi:MAG: LysR substrate-binding domain-containing protein [Deltaproteobacteria bacterium]|nr:LysR substrate-binding domain-containing protein [Deltaproteobacteria bacterium]